MRRIRTVPASLVALALVAPALPAVALAAEGGGAKPLVDWPVVLTQILGFLILLWGLRAFAWGPIIGFLEERRARIAEEFQEATRRQAGADELKARYELELKGIETQARQRIQEAVAQGQRVAAEIKAQAHHDATARIERAEAEIAREREKAKELLKEQVAALSIRTAEKILREKLDGPAQRRMVERFIDEVGPPS